MRYSLFTLLAAPLALAAPAPAPAPAPVELEARQSITENEFTRGGCRDIIFFFARGSTEGGNLGTITGQPLARALKQQFGDNRVAVEGVDYAAALSTNFLPRNADPAGIAELRNLFADAASRCPNSIIVSGGYSQGAAVNHAAIEDSTQAVKNRIAGVVLFGDTRNLQERGRIAGYPTDKTLIICNVGDLVCAGTLTITAAHLTYTADVPRAATFLTQRIRAAGLS